MAPPATDAAVLNWPVASAERPRLAARSIFGWARSDQHHQIDLWILDVDGTEYLSDRHVMIRRDRLTGINRLWARTIEVTPTSAPILARAEQTRLSSKPVKTRFDLRRIAALYLAGGGIRRLAGRTPLDLHAVVFGADRVGLAIPILATDPAFTLGVVPGLPPVPRSTSFVWEEW